MDLQALISRLKDFFLIRECQFFKLTGFYCPWCGGTRALKALFEKNIMESLYYHPIVIYIVFLGCAYCFRWGISLFFPLHQGKRIFPKKYIFLGCGIIGINWLVKNVILHM